MVVCIDETSKDERTLYRHYGRARRGVTPVIDAPFVQGKCYSIVAALANDGLVGARVVKGSVNSLEFLAFVAEEVVRRGLHMPNLSTNAEIVT